MRLNLALISRPLSSYPQNSQHGLSGLNRPPVAPVVGRVRPIIRDIDPENTGWLAAFQLAFCQIMKKMGLAWNQRGRRVRPGAVNKPGFGEFGGYCY
jgi:hypothetical protein